MIASPVNLSDASRTRLRSILASIQQDTSALSRIAESAEEQAVAKRLQKAWGEAVEVLALGPEPEVRDCPACGHVIRSAATRCGYCWIARPPRERVFARRAEEDLVASWENEGGTRAPAWQNFGRGP